MPDKINPYIAGAPVVEQRMFFGREDVFSWIERSLSGKFVDHILVIHGQRRVGKTSVLKHLPNRLPDRYIPIFVDLQGRVNTTLPRFLWWLSREIARALDMEKPDRDAFEDDPDFFESSFLPAMEQALGDHVLLLTFDEFDTLESTSAQEGLALPFMAILKRLMDYQKLNFIFSIGSSGRKLENMQAAYTNFFKQALYRKISFLSESDARDLITKPVEGVLSFDLDAVDYIFEITSGHPYFIQLICHELFSVSQKSEDWLISKVDVEKVLDAVIERGTVNLKFVWDEASELEKWVLAALAQFKCGADMKQLEAFLNQHRVRFIRQDLESAVLHLREKDVLASGNRFVIYLMKLWLIQNRSIEQVKEELARINPIVSRLLQVGHQYLEQGDHHKAIDSFQEALQAEEDNLEVRLGLAAAYMALEDYGRAAAEYEETLALYPEDVAAQSGFCDAYLALGDVRFTMDRLDEAEYAYQQVLRVSPRHADGRARMARLCRHRAVSAISGSEEAALEQIRLALDFTPDDPSLKASLSELEALVSGKQEIMGVLFAWGQRSHQDGNWQEALSLLSAYARLKGDDTSLSSLLDKLRKKARAEELDLLKAQAQRLERLDQYDDAIFAYNQYLNLQPDDAADTQEKISQLKEARRRAQKEEGRKDARPFWKRPLAWASFAAVALVAALLTIPTSPLRLALAPPAPTQEVVERIVVATPVPTIAPTPTLEPLPYKWNRVTSAQFLQRDHVTALAIHPQDLDVMYAGMNRSGMYKTIDGGITWFPAQEGFTRGWIKDILIHPEQPGTLYASAINAGVYRSEDDGEHWEKLDLGIENGFWQFTSDLFMNPEDPNHIIYTSGNEIKETRNNGETWKDIEIFDNIQFSNGSKLEALNSVINEVIYDPSSTNYIGVINSNHGSGNMLVLVSTDQGKSWQQQFEPLSERGSNILSVDPVNGLVLISANITGEGGPSSLYSSADGGITWGKADFSGNTERVHVATDGTYHFIDGSQLFSTENIDARWQNYSLPPDLEFSQASVSSSNARRVVISGQSLFISDDGGENWEQRVNGLGAASASIGLGDSSELIYIAERTSGYYDNRLFHLYSISDKSNTFLGESACDEITNNWENVICPPTDDEKFYVPFQNEPRLTDIVYKHDSGRYYAPYAPLYFRSDDYGESWFQCPAFNGWSDGSLKSSIAVNPADPDKIFLATQNTGLQISTDGCITLEKSSYIDNIYVNSIAIHPEKPDMVFAASDSGVYLSTNGGYTWDAINDGLLGAYVVYEVTIDPNDPENVYAVSSYGIFKLEEK